MTMRVAPMAVERIFGERRAAVATTGLPVFVDPIHPLVCWLSSVAVGDIGCQMPEAIRGLAAGGLR